MPHFTYAWIDGDGIRRKATAEAPDQSTLEHRLLDQGMALLDVAPAVRGKPSGPSFFTRKVSRRDLVELCIYAGSMVEAGISITTALRDFAAETRDERFRSILEGMASSVESGETLASTMAVHPDVFTTEFVSVVRAGERSGRLPGAFAEVRRWLEWQERIAGDIRQATTYPLVVSVILSLFILFLFSSVVPKIAKILEDMHLALPLITRLVLAVSHLATRTWWAWILLLVAIPLAVRALLRKSEPFAAWWDGQVLKIPVFGPLASMGAQARFAQNFAVLHRSGISILDNLELCTTLVGNRSFARALGFAHRDIQEGGTLAASLRRSGLFSALSIRMLAAGEATGDLERSLGNVAKYYDEELPRRIKQVFSLMEPALIVVLVAVVGTVALAIFLPIISLGSGLRR